MSETNENVLSEGTEVLTPESAAENKKKRKPLSEEQKQKMQQARKDNEARRFSNTREALITAFLTLGEQPDALKVILKSQEGKASKEQLQAMVDAKDITEDQMNLAISCGVIKKPASAGKESLPYKWGSFRDYTEGSEENNIPVNDELRTLLIEFTGRVEEFRENNKALTDAIAEHTSVITGKNEKGESITEGAEWMDYFRFPKSEEEKEAEAKAKADAEAKAKLGAESNTSNS